MMQDSYKNLKDSDENYKDTKSSHVKFSEKFENIVPVWKKFDIFAFGFAAQNSRCPT